MVVRLSFFNFGRTENAPLVQAGWAEKPARRRQGKACCSEREKKADNTWAGSAGGGGGSDRGGALLEGPGTGARGGTGKELLQFRHPAGGSARAPVRGPSDKP